MAEMVSEVELLEPIQSKPLEFKPQRRGRFTPEDIINVCRLMAEQGHTQESACLLLGIKPNSFAIWKCKANNQERFANLLAHAKTMLINGCFAQGMAVGNKDWRYWDKRLERIAPERFAQQTAPQQAANAMPDAAVALLVDMARKVYGELKPAPEIKQIGPVVEATAAPESAHGRELPVATPC